MAVFFYLMTEGEMENRTGDKSTRRTQRDYPLEFKEKVVREFESTDLSLSAISRKYGIQGESTVRRWLERYGTLNPEDAVLDRRFRSRGSLAGLEQKIVSLEQRIARLEDKVKELKDWVKQTLGDEVKEVLTKGRLVDSPAAVLNADSISPQMRAMLKAMNDSPLPKPVVDFEINTKSPVIKNLAALKESSPELAKLVLEQIFDNALLSAGLLENTTEMSKRLNEILAQIKA